jgi:hypothetical protein
LHGIAHWRHRVRSRTRLEAESGKRSDRPKLAKAIGHAKAIGATVVFAKLDRLTRNVDLLRCTFLAALVAGLGGFAFGIVAAAVWLYILTPLQTATLIMGLGLVVQGYSVWK